MKTNINKFRIVALIFLSGLLSISSFAQRGRGPQNQCRQIIPDLTDEQTEKISALRTTHMQQMTEYRAEVRVLKAELDQLSIAKNTDLNKINSKIDDLTAIKNNMTKAQYKHRQEVRNLLTDDQKAVFDARAGKGFGRGQGHGKGRGYGQGYGYGQENGPQQFSRNCIYNQNNRN